MAAFRNFVSLLMLSALLAVCLGQVSQGGPHMSQGGPHQNQGRIRRQAVQDGANQGQDEESQPTVSPQNPLNWTTCDITVIPRVSCHDCNTRVICKPVGGLLKPCNNPYRPHCNAGICSPIPSAECVAA